MSTPETTTDDQQRAAAILPALAVLDRQAAELEQAAAEGAPLDPGAVATYEVQAQHARHLLSEAGLTPEQITEAAEQHRGDGEPGFAERALDHTVHPRPYTSTLSTDAPTAPDQEEIDL
ncbi:hypothetical protein [Streptomyces sp. NPDC053560]|uniref:hypothetical protein n=1 Tax=Streptomyces sp. NPDC053560 TaxID=3365711 RepID=UPI0037D69C2D